MSSIVVKPDALEDLQLITLKAPDRLPSMLFLAALIHGILIIGITFNPYLIDDFANAISLEVTIVADPDQRIGLPDTAAYLAQASQQGGGNTREQVRPTAPLESVSPIDSIGREDGSALLDSTRHEKSADQLVSTQADQDRRVADLLRDEPQPADSTAIALEAGNEQTLPLPRDDIATLRIHDDDPRQLVISADTRESNIAAYVDSWKRRIEAVGNEYFPELGDLDGLSGAPTVEVSIEASGQLADVIIRKSSGSKVLDRAALDILRRASPFDPFPADIRADYDQLVFAYKWQFSERLIPADASFSQVL